MSFGSVHCGSFILGSSCFIRSRSRRVRSDDRSQRCTYTSAVSIRLPPASTTCRGLPRRPSRKSLSRNRSASVRRQVKIDFFGRDVALSHLCAVCADLLSARVPGSSRIVADLAQLFATYLAEKYTSATSGKPEVRGGLPKNGAASITPSRKKDERVTPFW